MEEKTLFFVNFFSYVSTEISKNFAAVFEIYAFCGGISVRTIIGLY